MIFVYKKWDSFCRRLKENQILSIPACDVETDTGSYVVLKHDVETNVKKAYRMAQIEAKYGHRGSYYVQAYLMDDVKNIALLLEMQDWGHEISYHYDVMDSQKGDLERAIEEFEHNRIGFEQKGFSINTVCQHGNPIIERVGYTSNRDFFRSGRVKETYPEISDIMVNFKEKHQTDYIYFSDAGRQFKMIYDPLNNDIIKSDDKDIVYKNLNELFSSIAKKGGNIVSTHPHRWTSSAVVYLIKSSAFKCIKFVSKILVKIPFMRKIMSKYYYLAKKI